MNHYWPTVDGWFDRRVRPAFDLMLADLPVDRPSVLVQVGTWVGRASAYIGVEIVNGGKPVTFVAVDHFKGSDEVRRHRRAAQIPESEANFRRNVAPLVAALGPRFVVMARDSVEAAGKFQDGSIDAVWIDAAHAYEYVVRDCEAWRSKVRPGGLLGGDDFVRCPGVAQAVTEHFTAEAGVKGTVYWMVRRQVDGSYLPEHR